MKAKKIGYGYILLKEKGGAKATFKKEFELVEALKERN